MRRFVKEWENKMFLLDSHCDTPSELKHRNISVDNAEGHVDFPKLIRGGVNGVFFALYIPASMSQQEGIAHADSMLEDVRREVSANSDIAAFAASADQARINRKNGLISVFLGLENGSPIGNSLELLRAFYDKGIRYMTLCHSKDNEICDSCASEVKTWGGLSPFGREVVAEMNRLGMLVDVSHVSDETFYDVIECSSSPVVATHSCCRALADHPRNMTDDMIRLLASKGGVIQINFYPHFLDSEWSADPENHPLPSIKDVADHIDHAVRIAGIDHVGLGSDFDGIEIAPSGLEDISKYPSLLEELRSRGYTEEEISKISGENFLRLL